MRAGEYQQSRILALSASFISAYECYKVHDFAVLQVHVHLNVNCTCTVLAANAFTYVDQY